MGFPENEELYLTLSRKELQGLCKKHGLPINRSKTDMAKLLVIHFTRKKTSSKEWRNRRATGSSKLGRTSAAEVKHNEPVNLREGIVADVGGALRKIQSSKSRSFALKEKVREKERYQSVNRGGNSSHMDIHASSKAVNATSTGSVYVAAQSPVAGNIQESGVLQQLVYECSHGGGHNEQQKSIEIKMLGQNLLNPTTSKVAVKNLQPTKSRNQMSGDCSSESGLASSIEIPAEVSPSFQFFVRSEEGINLFVDLKSRPSDWINSLKDEVTIFQKIPQDKPWTITSEIRDVDVVNDSLKSSSMVNEMHKNININADSKSPASGSVCNAAGLGEHLERNQVVSSSCTIFSQVQNPIDSGSQSCNADIELSPQTVADTSSVIIKSNDSVTDCSLNKISSNVMNLSTETTVTNSLTVKVDTIYAQNVELLSLDNIHNCLSETSDFSLSGKNQDSSKPSESDGVECCSRACHLSVADGPIDKSLLEIDVKKSADHICEEQTCSSLANSTTGYPISMISEERGRNSHMKEKGCPGCSQHNKLGKTRKRSYNSEVPEEFQSRRQHNDDVNHRESPTNMRNTKTSSRESTHDHGFLLRRSVRLVSK